MIEFSCSNQHIAEWWQIAAVLAGVTLVPFIFVSALTVLVRRRHDS